MRQVFISYSSKEAEQANEIVRALEAQGIECWIAPRNIRVGSNYTKDIPSAIQECPCFLLVLSLESQDSKWVNKELTRAINQDKRILPLMIEDFAISEGFTFLLEDVQTRPYYQMKDQILREVLDEIRALTPPDLSAEEVYKTALRSYYRGDYAPAAEGFRIAAERGHPGAQNMLGYCFDTGKGVDQNYTAAVSWYRKAIAGRNIAAHRHLGYSYEHGRGVEPDLAEARKWYEKAAERGDARAKEYLERLDTMTFKPAEPTAEACFQRGKAFADTKNYDEAVKWYQKAADMGHAEAQFRLGVCCYHGFGVSANSESAVAWYRKAAKQGHAEAQYQLGFCYLWGIGVSEDKETGVIWYLKAAAQGYTMAQFWLGYCYQYGTGIEANLAEARKWYKKAADQGHPRAAFHLKHLK